VCKLARNAVGSTALLVAIWAWHCGHQTAFQRALGKQRLQGRMLKLELVRRADHSGAKNLPAYQALAYQPG
jgi:hypothetical protein